jgi:hypothetical protein
MRVKKMALPCVQSLMIMFRPLLLLLLVDAL